MTMARAPDTPETEIEPLLTRLGEQGALDADALDVLLAGAPSARGLARLAAMLEAVGRLATGGAPASASDMDAGAVPRQLGSWRLLRLLGRGGMGEVWLAERCDGQVQQQAAIKRVRSATPALVKRMLRERQLLARLAHPHIARFLDAGIDAAGVPYLVMEYVDGLAIDRWCAEHAATLAQRVDLVVAVGEALAHAHRHLVIHRDLKPANVLVDGEGTPHLLDFGIARLLDDEAGHDTDTGFVAMTPAWAAPEQLLGGEVTTATDVHALGLLAFALLAGNLPAARVGTPLARLALRVAHEEPEPSSVAARRAGADAPVAPARLAGDLDAVIARALRAEPAQRYRDVESMLRDLRAWRAGLPVDARAGQRGYRLRRYAWRHRGWIAAASLAVAGIVGGAAMAWVQAQRALEASRTAQVVQRFLEDVFISADPWRARVPGQPTTALELAERGLARIESDLAGQPRAQAELYTRLARVFSIEGNAAEAARAAARADELYATLADARPDERAMARAVHAQYAFYAGEYDRGEAMLRELVDPELRIVSDGPRIAGVAYSLLHDIARDRGDYPQALRWLELAEDAFVAAAERRQTLDNLPYYRAMVEYRSGAIGAATSSVLDVLARHAADAELSPQWRAHVLDRGIKVMLAHGPRADDLALARRNHAQRVAMFGAGSSYDAQSQVTLAAGLLDAGDAAGAARLAALATERYARDDGRSARDAAEAGYLRALAALALGDDGAAAGHADAAAATFATIGGDEAPPTLAARAAALWSRRAHDAVATDGALATIARTQVARGDLETPRTLRWLVELAAARGDEQARTQYARQGLAVLAAQGRPAHASAAMFAAAAGAPPPAAPTAAESSLREAISAGLARVDADLAAVAKGATAR